MVPISWVQDILLRVKLPSRHLKIQLHRCNTIPYALHTTTSIWNKNTTISWKFISSWFFDKRLVTSNSSTMYSSWHNRFGKVCVLTCVRIHYPQWIWSVPIQRFDLFRLGHLSLIYPDPPSSDECGISSSQTQIYLTHQDLLSLIAVHTVLLWRFTPFKLKKFKHRSSPSLMPMLPDPIFNNEYGIYPAHYYIRGVSGPTNSRWIRYLAGKLLNQSIELNFYYLCVRIHYRLIKMVPYLSNAFQMTYSIQGWLTSPINYVLGSDISWGRQYRYLPYINSVNKTFFSLSIRIRYR